MSTVVAEDVDRRDDAHGPSDAAARGPSLLRLLLEDRLARVGLAMLLLFAVAAVAAPVLSAHDPTVVDATRRFLPPSLEHPLGTDHLGRDEFARIVFGARWSLGVAAVATVIVLAIGVVVGIVSGYYGGWLDSLIMRTVDVLLAFPNLVLFLAIVGTLGPGVRNVLIALVSITWVRYARIVRGVVLSVREQEFVDSALALGAPDRWVMRKHVLPAVISPVVVLASLETGRLVLSLAALGFFGLGVQPPTPEWGMMLNQGRVYLQSNPQLMIYPGLAISLVVLACNLVGDGLRDVLDPRLRL